MNRNQIVDKEKTYIGYVGNPNQFTRWYCKDNKEHAFCGMFQDYVVKHDMKLDWFDDCKNFAYVPTIVEWAKKKGWYDTNFKNAKQGDLVIYNWYPNKKNHYSHVGMVYEVKSSGIVSIEGNTTNAVGKKNCVAKKNRNKKYVAGIVHLPYTDEEKYNLTRLLKKGCKGSDVLELQKELNKRGYKGKNKKKLAEDKIFGDNVAYAVGCFQKDNKLTVDKKVGKNTAHALGWLWKGK